MPQCPALPGRLDFLVLRADVNSFLPVEAFPFPGRLHQLGPRVAACAALFQALVVAVPAASPAAYMGHLLVLSKAWRSL